MSDLRQGVSEAGHAILDAVEAVRDSHAGLSTRDLALFGRQSAHACATELSVARQRIHAVRAAAFYLLVVEALDAQAAAPAAREAA